jgi:outer membrane protein assembly factor BamB
MTNRFSPSHRPVNSLTLRLMSSFRSASALVIGSCLLTMVTLSLPASDWPQWRGPLRNGVIPDSPALASQWPDDGPKLLWESDPIPANDDGGHGSPIVADGRVYLSVVWHEDVPSETRTISDLVLRKLGYQNPNALAPEVRESLEQARMNLGSKLRGKALDDAADKWIAEHLDKRQQDTMSGFIRGRFKKGPLAISFEDYAKMNAVENKPFPNDEAFKKWVDEQNFSDHAKAELLAAVPPTRRVAQDTVVCLDLDTGKTLWKAAAPGEPRGRSCSSTAAVADGKVFSMGSTHLYAVDAANGKILWSTPLPSKAPGSSVLAVDGAVVINAGKFAAYDAATGKQLWQQQKLGGGNGSPVAWKGGGKTVVILNARNELTGIDLKSGDVVWTTPGGGDSTPAILDDTLTVQTKSSQIGLLTLRLRPDGI